MSVNMVLEHKLSFLCLSPVPRDWSKMYQGPSLISASSHSLTLLFFFFLKHKIWFFFNLLLLMGFCITQIKLMLLLNISLSRRRSSGKPDYLQAWNNTKAMSSVASLSCRALREHQLNRKCMYYLLLGFSGF